MRSQKPKNIQARDRKEPMTTTVARKKPHKITARKFARMEWDPALRERKTTTDYLAAALRTAIYDGQFTDGEELNQVELAKYFSVSRVPIREALRQLQAEGLVRIIAHRHAMVAGLSTGEILEFIEMRAILESYLIRKCAPEIDGGTMKRLRALCDEMDRITDYGASWVMKNWEFHQALYKPAGAGKIIETVEHIHLNVERYARQAGTAERLRTAAAEHRLILDCVERKDYASASTQLERHILNTGEAIRRFREK